MKSQWPLVVGWDVTVDQRWGPYKQCARGRCGTDRAIGRENPLNYTITGWQPAGQCVPGESPFGEWYTFSGYGYCDNVPLGTDGCTFTPPKLTKAITWDCISSIHTSEYPDGGAIQLCNYSNTTQVRQIEQVLALALDKCPNVQDTLPPMQPIPLPPDRAPTAVPVPFRRRGGK